MSIYYRRKAIAAMTIAFLILGEVFCRLRAAQHIDLPDVRQWPAVDRIAGFDLDQALIFWCQALRLH